ncbi:perlucin-like protein [Ylistrum balloti]|uniref:perlucin-like protein n=1 Tax=Ylistrum balloti TaxID=509963 RepID=UPI002905C1C3|nr:perlucin-like protein [Ylistrum balloti]
MTYLARFGPIFIVVLGQVICGCPNGWETYNSSCYFVSDDRKNWTAASDACSSFHAHLAEVEDAQEDNFLRQMLIQLHTDHRDFWLGGNDIFVEGDWRWYESGQYLGYTNWNPGEPNNHHSSGEDCLEGYLTYSHSTFRWRDRPCMIRIFYICEIKENRFQWIELGRK